MPSLKVHCYLSKKRIGTPFSELHTWIDEPHLKYEKEHRSKRHSLSNEKDMEYVKEKWGGLGVVEWAFHIAVDHLEASYKWSQYYGKKYNYFEFGLTNGNFIYFDLEEVDKNEIEQYFTTEDELAVCASCNMEFPFTKNKYKKTIITCPYCSAKQIVEK